MNYLYFIISKTRRLIRGIVTVFSCRIIRRLLLKNSASFQLSYAADKVNDGLGAQIQRQLSIQALSHYLSIGHNPKPLEQITIHPLDSFQTFAEMKAFLERVNRAFQFNVHQSLELPVSHQIASLTVWKLLCLSVISAVRSKPIHISTWEVYSIVDFLPNFYLKNLSQRVIGVNPDFIPEGQEFICVHFRQGVGGKVVYPGQKISRELDLDYFMKTLSKTNLHGKKILILTDAPVLSMEYKPITDQLHLWDGTPKFNQGTMSITGLDLKSIFRQEGYDVEVISGGDPLLALTLMANCDTLIMSRSSLSYVAAILNRVATIYYPPGFWHPPMTPWKI